MRSVISALALIGFAVVCRGAPADVWPAQRPALSIASVRQKLAEINAAGPGLPAVLGPAIRFQAAYIQILAGAPVADWLPEIKALAAEPGDEVVTRAVRDLAKAWLARAQMQEIADALDSYYVENVRYPASLAEVEPRIPAEWHVDPWGEKWAYSLHAPAGFAKETQQRYQLGPARYPALGTLSEAVAARPRLPQWKIVPRPAGAGTALEFQSGGKVAGVIEAGGKIDIYTLVYAGDHWALMAGVDQLFTVAF